MTWKGVMKYRNELFGISALWIILFHVQGNVGNIPIPRLPSIIGMGNMGVDVFLFLSAIGLYYSYKKNRLSDYYLHRCKRVLLPYLIVAIPYFAWYHFVFASSGFIPFLLDVSTIGFWVNGDHPTWYIAFILIAYAIYPLLHKLFAKNKYLSFGILLVVAVSAELVLWMTNSKIYANAERALSRIPVFLLGMLFAYFVEENKKIPKVAVFISFAVLLLGVVVFPVTTIGLPIFAVRYLYGILSVAFLLSYAFIRQKLGINWLGRAMKWVGEISLECYILHVFAIRILNALSLWQYVNKYLWYALILALTLLLAKAFKLFVDKLISLIHTEENKCKSNS